MGGNLQPNVKDKLKQVENLYLKNIEPSASQRFDTEITMKE